jgi:hypothetical protein
MQTLEVIVIDLNADLFQLRAQEKEAMKSTVEQFREDDLKLVHFDWILTKIETCRKRYGTDAEIWVVGDNPYRRPKEKLHEIQKRYAKEGRGMVRSAANDPELVGNVDTKKSNRFGKDRRNRRKRRWEENEKGLGIDYEKLSSKRKLFSHFQKTGS